MDSVVTIASAPADLDTVILATHTEQTKKLITVFTCLGHFGRQDFRWTSNG